MLLEPEALQDRLRPLPEGPGGRGGGLQDPGSDFDRLALWASRGPKVEAPERRLWLDDRAGVSVVLDDEDYQWALQWLWRAKPDKHGHKLYAFRSQSNGGHGFTRKNVSLYLHVEIMKRTGIPRPSPLHLLVDHRNGDSLFCRRSNLRWATRSMNRLNILGKLPHDLIEG